MRKEQLIPCYLICALVLVLCRKKIDFGGIGWEDEGLGVLLLPLPGTQPHAGNTIHQGQFNSPANWMRVFLDCANSAEHLRRWGAHLRRWGRRHPHKLQPLQNLRNGAKRHAELLFHFYWEKKNPADRILHERFIGKCKKKKKQEVWTMNLKTAQKIQINLNHQFSRVRNSRPHRCLYAHRKRRSYDVEGLAGKEPEGRTEIPLTTSY